MMQHRQFQEIAFIPDVFTWQRTTADVKALLTSFVLFPQKQLQHLFVLTRGHLPTILSVLQVVPYEMSKQTRNGLQITLEVDVADISSTEQFVNEIFEVITAWSHAPHRHCLFLVQPMCTATSQHGSDIGDRDQQRFNCAAMKKAVKANTDKAAALHLLFCTPLGFAVGIKEKNPTFHEQWWHKGVRII